MLSREEIAELRSYKLTESEISAKIYQSMSEEEISDMIMEDVIFNALELKWPDFHIPSKKIVADIKAALKNDVLKKEIIRRRTNPRV